MYVTIRVHQQKIPVVRGKTDCVKRKMLNLNAILGQERKCQTFVAKSLPPFVLRDLLGCENGWVLGCLKTDRIRKIILTHHWLTNVTPEDRSPVFPWRNSFQMKLLCENFKKGFITNKKTINIFWDVFYAKRLYIHNNDAIWTKLFCHRSYHVVDLRGVPGMLSLYKKSIKRKNSISNLLE